MNLTGERPGASAGGSAGSASCDFDNSSITSGILIYLLSVGCGKPGARSILFSNLLFRLDFSTLSAAGESSPKKEDYPAYVEQGGESARGLHAIRVLEN